MNLCSSKENNMIKFSTDNDSDKDGNDHIIDDMEMFGKEVMKTAVASQEHEEPEIENTLEE